MQNEEKQNEEPTLAEQYDPGDPFAAYANDVDTSYPVIPVGLYDMTIKEAKRELNRDQSGEKIGMQLATTAPCTSVTGEPVSAGFIVMHNIGITETPKYSRQMIARAVSALLQALGKNVRIGDFVHNPSMVVGDIVRVKIGIQKETEEFAARNKVNSFVKV